MVVDLYLYYRFLFMLLFPKQGAGEGAGTAIGASGDTSSSAGRGSGSGFSSGNFKCPTSFLCMPAEDCSELHANRNLETVLFQCENKSKVCCPPVRLTKLIKKGPPFEENPPETRDYTTHRNARLVKEEYCGTKLSGNRIGNGEETALLEFPWMALLGVKYKNSNHFICGGTLINRRYVLTAAHCITAESIGREIEFVRLMEHNISNPQDCYPALPNVKPLCITHEDIEIEKIIKHPQYKKTTFKNDIALLRLAWNADPNATSVCLPLQPSKLNLKDETQLEIAGWGRTENPGMNQSDVLKKATTTKISFKECNICTNDRVKFSFCPLSESQICVEGAKSGDACKGDSGGPLMYEDTSEQSPTVYQVGITSFKTSDACGDQLTHSMYTNVVYYMDWILDNIKD